MAYAARTGLFGRQDGCARVETALDAALHGPAGLALEGAPGIGKTTLWRSAVATARDRGYSVISTAPGAPDAALAFSGLGDLLDGLPNATLDALPDPQRRALRVALCEVDSGLAPSDPLALPRAVLNVTRALAADAPLLVAIDDEQWLDRPSARALAFALCRIRSEPICVLLARRPGSDGALWPELARGFGGEGLQTLVLPPLDCEAIHDVLAARLHRTFPRALLRRICEISAGNPFYALMIAGELESSDAPRELALPATLLDAAARRLGRIDPVTAEPLLVVAAASNATLGLVQAVLGEFSLSDLDSAERAGVIEISGERIRFSHPLLASAHYQRMPAARRREVHRLLVEVVSDSDERAHHLALGAEAPERRTAVALEHAAAVATRRGAPESAAYLLEQAARLTPANILEAKRSRLIAAAEQHLSSGSLYRARAILEALRRELPSGPMRARVLLLLAKLRNDDLEVSAALLEQVLTETGSHDRLTARAHHHLSEVWSNRGDQANAHRHARAAVALAQRVGDHELLAQALAQQESPPSLAVTESSANSWRGRSSSSSTRPRRPATTCRARRWAISCCGPTTSTAPGRCWSARCDAR